MTPSEINEAVAVGLGWRKNVKIGELGNAKWYRDGEISSFEVPANYCRDIEAAFECLKDREWQLERILLIPADLPSIWTYRCSFRIGPDEMISARADTAPMAICLAFLKLQ